MKKVGIPACIIHPNLERATFGPKRLSFIENDFANYLARKNVMPILIPDLQDVYLYDFLEQLDGFVFQGGVDMAPQSYNEQPIGKWKGDAYRDAFEHKIFDYAFNHNRPILGICRGCQLMNVYFGGTLYQDINTQKPDALVHRDAITYDSLHHPITFTKDSLLAQIYADVAQPIVNSIHHQGIKDLGNDLQILAVSTKDQIIEAIGYTGDQYNSFMLAVQWHPEFSHTLANLVLDPEKLYDAFIEKL